MDDPSHPLWQPRSSRSDVLASSLSVPLNLSNLIIDALIEIFRFLDIRDIIALRLVSPMLIAPVN